MRMATSLQTPVRYVCGAGYKASLKLDCGQDMLAHIAIVVDPRLLLPPLSFPCQSGAQKRRSLSYYQLVHELVK